MLKVADFGIAKVVGAQGARLRRPRPCRHARLHGARAGELLRRPAVGGHRRLGDRARCSTSCSPACRRCPSTATSATCCSSVYRGGSARLGTLAPDVPGAVGDVVMRALARDPRDRYPTAAGIRGGARATPSAGARWRRRASRIHRTERPGRRRAAGGTATRAVGAWVGRAGAPSRPTGARPPCPADARRRQVPPRGAGAARVGRDGRRQPASSARATGDERDGGPASGASRGGARCRRTRARLARRCRRRRPGGRGRGPRLQRSAATGRPARAERLGRGGLTYEAYGGDAAAGQDWSNAPDQQSPGGLRRGGAAQRPAAVRDLLPAARARSPRREGRDRPGLRKTLVDPRADAPTGATSGSSCGRSVRRDAPSRSAWSRASGPFSSRASAASAAGAAGRAGARRRRGPPGARGTRGRPARASRGDGSGCATATRRDAVLGFGVTDYGTNVDISRQLPSRATLIAAARDAGHFYIEPGDFDFAALEIAYSEEGQNPNRTRGLLAEPRRRPSSRSSASS